MLNIGNDMEELLRHASQNYPLKEGEDRWDEINERVNNNSLINEKKSKRFFVIPLIIMALILQHSFLYTNDLKILPVRSSFTEIKTTPVSEKGKKNDKENNIQSYNSVLFKPNSTKGRRLIKPLYYASYVKLEDKRNASIVIDNAEIIETSNFDGSESGQQLIEEISGKDSISYNDSTIKDEMQLTLTVKSEPETLEKKQTRGFYFGALVALNGSTVKMESMAHAGYSIGLIAGYRISSHTSVETGMFYGKKRYNSQGKYFSDKYSAMPAGMKIINLSGNYNLLEIPIQIKYNFSPGRKRNLFGTAGITSALITKEQNDYKVKYNSNEQMMRGSYNDIRKYVAASFTFSIGFEQNYKNTTLRFEPFMQIPLKGVGIGSMPVTTFGIRAGIIR